MCFKAIALWWMSWISTLSFLDSQSWRWAVLWPRADSDTFSVLLLLSWSKACMLQVLSSVRLHHCYVFFSLWLLLRLQSDKHFHSVIDVKFCGSKSLLMLYTSSLYGTYITQIWQWTDTPCVSFAGWLQYWHCVGQNNSKDRYLKVFIYENCS